MQRLATALVVLATALRLCLPWWHDASCRHHQATTANGSTDASEVVSSACACAADPDPQQPWWTAGDDRGEGRGDDGDGEPSHAAAFAAATCLACELSHVPPGPPPLPIVVAIPDFDDAPAASRPDEEPRPAATTTPPSRAPPHRRVAA